MYYKDTIKIGCDRYKIIETETEDVYSLVSDDLPETVITGSLYDCITKATRMFRERLWNE